MSEQHGPVAGSTPPPAGWPAPYGAPPAPPAAMSFPHAEPTPYHQMLRTWAYAWWRPVVGILICAFGFFIVAALVYIVVALIAAPFGPGGFIDNFSASADLTKHVTPWMLLGLNLGLASLVLVTWFVMRVFHHMRPRWLSSVRPRLRWKFFAACLGLSVVALAAQVAVGAVIPGNSDDISGHLHHFTTSLALSALVVLLTTPLQAAGEEYLFRGYLMMAVGSFFPRSQEVLAKWVAIVVTGFVFALAHGSQNFPLFFDRFAFGLIAAWLVTRTGGLEAGLALHVLNNFLAFGIALAVGDLTDTLSVTGASWWNILVTVTQSVVYTVLVVIVAGKMGVEAHTSPPLRDPARPVGEDVVTA
jgi:membrane protease YdiL (CAAX protease family)